MMTQTHLLLAASLFTKPGRTKRNIAVITGALIPDASIFALFAYATLTGLPGDTLWNQTYWTEPWQSLSAISNSIPLYLVFLVAALLTATPKDGRPRWQSLPALFCLAALAHLATDFPVHHDDAHIHFWPLSDWRFHSPISYWDREHHGGSFAIFEAAFGIALMSLLYVRFRSLWVRLLLGLSILSYIAVPAYFALFG